VDKDRNRLVFDRIRQLDAWTCGSGPGSAAQSTLAFRYFLESFIVANAIRSMVDFGCGDFQFMQHVPARDLNYVGFDVVEPLVNANNAQFATARRSFRLFQGDLGELPEADLLVCKDVMIHWPNSQISQFLEVVLPRYQFSLLVNDVSQSSLSPEAKPNEDTDVGGFRALRLELPPFSVRGAVVLEYHGSIDGNRLFWKKAVYLHIR